MDMTPLEKSGYGMVRDSSIRIFTREDSMRTLEDNGYGLVHDNGNWRGAKAELIIAVIALAAVVFAGAVVVIIFGAN